MVCKWENLGYFNCTNHCKNGFKLEREPTPISDFFFKHQSKQSQKNHLEPFAPAPGRLRLPAKGELLNV